MKKRDSPEIFSPCEKSRIIKSGLKREAGVVIMGSRGSLKTMNPASGAIIMAIGIFLFAPIDAFPFLHHVLGGVLAVGLALIGLNIYQGLTRQFFDRNFLIPFLKNPVNSFTMGTWIAGMSVICNVLVKYYPSITLVVQIIAGVNTVLWLLFLVSCGYNFKQLVARPTSHATHGVVLLSTVATQSIVIVWVNLFPFFPDVLINVVMGLGFIFYLCGFILIAVRYGKETEWTLADHWTNTNCIIHGALSISGLALVTANIGTPLFLMIFWLIVFGLLLVIETIEVTRAVKRVHRLGWRKGLFTYNISQWSRNFTFGMFYAFSMTMHNNPHYMNVLYNFHEKFLAIWAWIVLIVLIAEIVLWADSKWSLFGGKMKEKAI
ncbi:TDT family transporter [Halobacillus amylolyticus]|uniref:Voltage-dependent anion channel n=1 Tax=Halobacillus amylolyticus TaxID=2932259 RepID=A0ABY4H7T9_9BACI|nr:hypothetical protein [Halobacillus amylolyticus]UOR10852.1 hypothetical protein MUO15_14665 [Halobacillus amylolyticus]